VGGTEGGRQILYRRYCINQYNSPLYKLDRNWPEVTLAKTSWAVTRDREKIGQQLTGTSPVTIPETIVGNISAPVPFFFLKWQFSLRQEGPN